MTQNVPRGTMTIGNALRCLRVAAPSIHIVPWAALASCWPLPQQLLPVSAAGGGRRRCWAFSAEKCFLFARREDLRIFPSRFFHGWRLTLSVTPYSVPDSPFCRCATSVPLFVTYGDISPRPGRICPGRGKSFLSGGAFCIFRSAQIKLPLSGELASSKAR